jgi:CBS domain containing-hemolysin-like protein
MADVLVPTLIIAGLIAMNGLFVAAEFAIVAVPRAVVQRRARTGGPRARLLARVVGDARELDRFIATAQLGITLASLGLGMYGEHLLAEWLAGVFEAYGVGVGRWLGAHTLASVAAIAFLTYWHIVVGEMVPKALALQRAERVTYAVAPLMRTFELVAFPLVLTLNGLGNTILRILGIERSATGAEFSRTPKELEHIVRESQEAGLLRPEAARVLQDLLDFGELAIRDVMIPRVRIEALPEDADHKRIRGLLERVTHTRYPVYRDTLDRIIGVVHVRDLAALPPGTPLPRDVVRPASFVPESLPVDRLLDTFHREGTRVAIAMDEHGGTAGLATLADVLDEVLGEVENVADVSRSASGEVRARGEARLDEVGELLELDLEHDEVDTVSGLVLDRLGRPARVGDRVTFRGLAFEVLSVQGHGVAEVRITPRRPARGSS